ncbi:hypothetical protein ABZ619_23685 [Streptomyces sp. NPDC007851]|uniref:hypothetical protein n=1 Tax=Streptomyces sp. NPDC007851 TaxID=3155008 RepID=UPI003403F315
MKPASGSTRIRISPRAGAWDYGDFPYALEPLIMPPTGHARAFSGMPEVSVERCATDLVLRELAELAGGLHPVDRVSDALESARASSVDQLFWFRWITGHQVTFLIWHLMGRLLSATPAGGVPSGASLVKLEAYVYGYCAMLLYCGSCPRDLYDSLIRPRMFLQHRAFSGTWAPDFAPVRGLFRGRGLRAKGREAAELSRAVEVNQAVHEGIAARLVPSGRSLLQQSMTEVPVRPSERTAVIYDNFFLTLRARVGDEGVTAQLLHRLRAVATDLAANGLHPLGDDLEDRPEELLRAEVLRCESRIGHLLHQVGKAAAGHAHENRLHA